MSIHKLVCLGSVAGSVIQATGRTEFEDGPRIGNQPEAGNGLQRVHTIPEINATIVPGLGWSRFLQRQTKGQNSAKFRAISGINVQLLLWC